MTPSPEKLTRKPSKLKLILILLSPFIIAIMLGISYLVWFSIQGNKTVNAAMNFYRAAQEEKNLAPYTCKDNYLAISKNTVNESLHGKLEKDIDFHANKRKRGTPFPEKEFIAFGSITRDGVHYYVDAEVHNENGKFLVCDIEEHASPE